MLELSTATRELYYMLGTAKFVYLYPALTAARSKRGREGGKVRRGREGEKRNHFQTCCSCLSPQVSLQMNPGEELGYHH